MRCMGVEGGVRRRLAPRECAWVSQLTGTVSGGRTGKQQVVLGAERSISAAWPQWGRRVDTAQHTDTHQQVRATIDKQYCPVVL